jgi:hypothetical protein
MDSAGPGTILSLGVEFAATPETRDFPSLIELATTEVAASFIVVPLLPLSYSDFCLTFDQWNSLVVGVLSEDDLSRQLSWAKHLSLSAVILPEIPSDYISFAQRIYSLVLQFPCFQYWIRIPVDLRDPNPSFSLWRKISAICENSPILLPVLQPIGNDFDTSEVSRPLQRWEAENVAAVYLNSEMALKGALKKFLRDLFQFDIRVVVGRSGSGLEEVAPVCEAIHALWNQQEPLTDAAYFALEYRDLLQVPLQPLGDHLQSKTYEVGRFYRKLTFFTKNSQKSHFFHRNCAFFLIVT